MWKIVESRRERVTLQDLRAYAEHDTLESWAFRLLTDGLKRLFERQAGFGKRGQLSREKCQIQRRDSATYRELLSPRAFIRFDFGDFDRVEFLFPELRPDLSRRIPFQDALALFTFAVERDVLIRPH